MGKLWQTTATFLSTAILGGLAALSPGERVLAQSSLPVCLPPTAEEFLVLVFTPSEPLREEVKRQVGRTLPQNHGLLVCEYGGNVLSRVGGFRSQAQAMEWAEYFDGAVGLPAMVITPVAGAETTSTVAETVTMPVAEVIVPTETGLPKPEREIPIASLSSAPTLAPGLSAAVFRPEGLTGKGFGILVDYGVNPAVATQLKVLLNQELSLVVYAAHGYLLVERTEDSGRVTALLNQLNQSNFSAIAVPLDQIILLKKNITP